ncbi:MAG: RNA polymerase sigma factor region1.1 domain-containing protein, partial [Alcanivoracaceae bacterium]|nr:RNA polymerase sigma factor region1.1 domain-containing protein [Alcanivoracaceae bacterium]
MATEKEQQQSQLKLLITLGKEQGYLTYAEVNDHLPDSITDTDQVEDIIQMINDMGIPVVEKASDAEQLLMDESPDSGDEVAAEEAAAVLAAVENEPGRTTDPVRMYMREMGTVELLTREGEIEIAKRIEEGIREVLHAVAYWPGVIETVVAEFDKVATEERRLSDIIAGYLDPNDDGAAAATTGNHNGSNNSDELSFAAKAKAKAAGEETDDDDSDSDDDSDEDDGSLDPVLAAERFNELKSRFEKLQKSLKRNGRDHSSSAKALEAMAEHFTLFKLVPRIYDDLLRQVRESLDTVRKLEKEIMLAAVKRGRMPRADFIATFPGNESNLSWVDDVTSGKKAKPWADSLKAVREDIERAQRRV